MLFERKAAVVAAAAALASPMFGLYGDAAALGQSCAPNGYGDTCGEMRDNAPSSISTVPATILAESLTTSSPPLAPDTTITSMALPIATTSQAMHSSIAINHLQGPTDVDTLPVTTCSDTSPSAIPSSILNTSPAVPTPAVAVSQVMVPIARTSSHVTDGSIVPVPGNKGGNKPVGNSGDNLVAPSEPVAAVPTVQSAFKNIPITPMWAFAPTLTASAQAIQAETANAAVASNEGADSESVASVEETTTLRSTNTIMTTITRCAMSGVADCFAGGLKAIATVAPTSTTGSAAALANTAAATAQDSTSTDTSDQAASMVTVVVPVYPSNTTGLSPAIVTAGSSKSDLALGLASLITLAFVFAL